MTFQATALHSTIDMATGRLGQIVEIHLSMTNGADAEVTRRWSSTLRYLSVVFALLHSALFISFSTLPRIRYYTHSQFLSLWRRSLFSALPQHFLCLPHFL